MNVRLQEIKHRQRAAAIAFTERLMDAVLGEAQRIVPYEEGTLAGTADRQTIVLPDGTVRVIGSFSTVYAEVQHERLDYQHAPGRQAKYLEEPFKRSIAAFERGLAAAVRSATR